MLFWRLIFLLLADSHRDLSERVCELDGGDEKPGGRERQIELRAELGRGDWVDHARSNHQFPAECDCRECFYAQNSADPADPGCTFVGCSSSSTLTATISVWLVG